MCGIYFVHFMQGRCKIPSSIAAKYNLAVHSMLSVYWKNYQNVYSCNASVNIDIYMAINVVHYYIQNV